MMATTLINVVNKNRLLKVFLSFVFLVMGGLALIGVYKVVVTALITKTIDSFTITNQVGSTVIDQDNFTISLTMPFETVVTALVPSITYSGASLSPLSGVANDFTSATNYTVTASNSSTNIYAVTVLVQDLTEARAAAISELDSVYYGSYSSGNYTTANWGVLSDFYSNGVTAINSATHLSDIIAAKNTAINGMAGVLTNAVLSDAKDSAYSNLGSAYNSYNPDNYSTSNWTTLYGYFSNGYDAIYGATTLEGVASALSTATNGMNSVSALYYYVSPTGTDDNTHGKAIGTYAFRTIQYAINDNRVIDGTIIYVADGTYSLSQPVQIDKGIQLIGSPSSPGDVIVQAPVTETQNETGDMSVFLISHNDVTISGFHIENAIESTTLTNRQNFAVFVGFQYSPTAMNTYVSGIQNITIDHNIISNSSHGIHLYNNQNVTISYNQIYDIPLGNPADSYSGGKGIVLYSNETAHQLSNIDILHNIIHNCGFAGIVIDVWEGDITNDAYININSTIDSNTIYNNVSDLGATWGGIYADTYGGFGIRGYGHEAGLNITNNEIYGQTTVVPSDGRFWAKTSGIRMDAAKDVVFADNNIHDNYRGLYLHASGTPGEYYTIATENTGHQITGNTFEDNVQGLVVDRNIDGISASNTFSGNTDKAVVNLGTSTYAADNNWWGTAVNATIQSMVTSYVTFAPYYVNSGLSILSSTAPATVYVDSTYSEGSANDGHDFGYDAFTTIQAGIGAVAANGTINIASGTFTEVGQIVITKNLSIVGAGIDTTIIKANADTGNSGDPKGWWVVNPSIVFNLNGVTLNGNGHKIYQGIRDKGTGTIQNVHFTDISYNPSTDYAGFGIYAFGGVGAVNVSYCVFDNIGREGIAYYGSGTTGTYSHNTYTGKGTGDWWDYGVEVTMGAIVTISNSTITNNIGASGGFDSAGIIVLENGSIATITGNTITGNTIGIKVGYNSPNSTAVAHAHSNTISGNDTNAIHGGATGEFDASNNWWGTHTYADVQAKVSGTVTFLPYYMDAGMTTLTSDLTAYNAALAAVIESNYSTASWSTYQGVVSANVVTVENTQGEVTAATLAISTAQSSLIFAGQEALNAAVLYAGGLTGSIYTTDSWDALIDALVLTEGSNANVLAKTTTINNAITGLVLLSPVYYVSPAGTDDAIHGTESGSYAFKTIQYAINDSRVSSGTTINVVAGTYNENVVISGKTGITVQGVGDTTLIEPTTGIGFEIRTSNNITIENLKIHTSGGAAHGILVDGTGTGGYGTPGGGVSNNLHIENTTIDAGGTGIWGDSSANGVHSDWFIDHNTITGAEGGIGFQDVTNSTVSNNTVTAADGTNILLTSERYALSNLVIDHNTVSGSAGSEVAVITDYNEREGGIMLEDPIVASTISGITFSNNTFSNWGSRAIRVGEGDGTATTGTVTAISITGNTFQMTMDTPQVIGGTDVASATGSGNIFNVHSPAKIQTAIDSAFAGETINVGAGSYSENITVNKALTLVGADSSTVTVTAANASAHVFDITASDVTISGFTATGATGGSMTYAGMNFQSSNRNCDIHDNILTGNQYGILLIEPENTTDVGNNTFTNNTASSNSVSGIEMQHSYGNTFTNNTANSNGGQGFRLDSARNNTFSGNTANSNPVGFFLVKGSGNGSNYNTFTSNIANSNTQYGMRMDYGDHNTLTGNTYNSNTIAGLKLKQTVTNLTVNFNNIISSNPTGILIDSSVNDVTTWAVNHNNISGNSTYNISNSGTGTLDATSNWWGTHIYADVLSKITGSVTFLPYYMDDVMNTLTSDLTAYNTALAAVHEVDYTSGSWTTYQGVVSTNVVTVENTQGEVNAATLAISTAQGSLVTKIDANLAAAKASAGALTEGNYTIVTWGGLTTALALPETNNTEKIAKTTAINDAITALVLKADLTAYNAALAAVHQADYTTGSWSTYQGVVSANVVTVENTQGAVNTATANISAAQGSLVFAGKADLDSAKAAEALLHPADYLSYSAVTTALAMPETTNAEVVAKTTAINDAIAALVTNVAANDLASAKAAEDLLTPSDYVDYSAVTTALGLSETTNAQILTKTTAINNAISALIFAGKADLDAAKAAEALLHSADYVSYSAVTTALAMPETTNAEVVAKTTAINNAIAGLVFAGKADLDSAKATAAGLTSSNYTIVSWGVLTTALALPETTNAQVVAKTTAINNAISALVLKADLTAYNAALAAVHEADYTTGSWSTYQGIVSANVVTVENTQGQVNTATGNITTAQGSLVFAGKSDLDSAKAAEALLHSADYVSYSAVTTALAMPETTNAEVVAKTTAINNAIAGLVFAGKADLDTAKGVAGGLTSSNYTIVSWGVLTTALALPETTNAEVVAKTTAINNAVSALVLKADLTAYNAALAAVTETDYTVGSWSTYQGVVSANVVTVENTQGQVNTATGNITAAQASLVFAGKADLDTAKGVAAGLTSSNYTIVSWGVLTTALALPETTNAEVVAKTTAINNAVSALVLKADLTAYNAALAAVTETDFTFGSWATYQVVVATNVVTVESTQGQVNTATGNITTAQGSLVFAGKADLDSAKATAAGLTSSNYTIVSWGVLTTALALPETTNAEVVAKTTAINNAVSALVLKADLTAYNAALASVHQADYTVGSWSTYQGVVSANIVTVENTQGQVNTATANISAAQASLVTLLADAKVTAKADVASALAGYTEGNYTGPNWITLNAYHTNGDIAIDGAADLTAVGTAKDTAINGMASVYTIAHTLADAKVAAKGDVATALAGYTEGNYTGPNWITLNTYHTDGDVAIDAAGNLTAVDTAKNNAISGMAGVETIAQTLAAAKVTAHGVLTIAWGTYSEPAYSSPDWITLTGFKTAGDLAINAATNITEVNLAQSTATIGMADVHTKFEAVDHNNDGIVDELDFAILAINWGTDHIAADYNDDGVVDELDFALLAINWTI